jgi:alginate O-acetyltransferase complex protein AlgI
LVFAATGLWHGASMNFVLWGLWHGLFIIIERFLGNHINFRSPAGGGGGLYILKHIYTLAVVLLGWVLFRSDNIAYAASYFKTMFGWGQDLGIKVSAFFYINSFRLLILFLAAIFSMPVTLKVKSIIAERCPNKVIFTVMHTMVCCVIFLISAMMIMNSNYNPFIYFRF